MWIGCSLVLASSKSGLVSFDNTKVLADSRAHFERILELTNEVRQKEGLKPVQLDAHLMLASQWLAYDMASKNYFDHVDSRQRTLRYRLEAFGAWFTRACENISAGQRTGDEVFQGWMNSPGHRKNILNPDVTQMGLGVATNIASTYRTYWVMDFRKPRVFEDSSEVFKVGP